MPQKWRGGFQVSSSKFSEKSADDADSGGDLWPQIAPIAQNDHSESVPSVESVALHLNSRFREVAFWIGKRRRRRLVSGARFFLTKAGED
jgi:hypothetical protein